MTFGSGGLILSGLTKRLSGLAPIESVPTILVYYRNFTLVNGMRTQFIASQGYPEKFTHRTLLNNRL